MENTIQNKLGPPVRINNQENAPQANVVVAFPQLRPLFPSDFHLHQVDRKLASNGGSSEKETGSLGRFKTSLRENILGSPKELVKLSVPSLVYAVQNNMAFLALSHLDAAVYQVEQNRFLGFGAIAIAVLCSGFAVLASVRGLYTCVVVKFITDNFMKGFSAAAATVLSTIASVILFGLQLTLNLAVGALPVYVSIYLYGLPRQDTTSIQQEATSKERIISGV
ncbi:CMP-sialic acid transporter-like [Onychomys torridus]|uniref:CMP-sialic acid transporter-like n=1 Tax=Onychomys torridus TaxID=38674 RepID=UPI00167F878D|nr:CMP-sialic acid transporter-like [Onychomys torridus]